MLAEDAGGHGHVVPTSTAAPAAAAPYRGKCLYKTGKCNNERALKTSGQPHNLCEAHRNRQNEHQRKLDAKNRCARKDKAKAKAELSNPMPSVPNTQVLAAVARATAAAAAAAAGHHPAPLHHHHHHHHHPHQPPSHRYMPYNKVRMSPTAGGEDKDFLAAMAASGGAAGSSSSASSATSTTSAAPTPMHLQFHATAAVSPSPSAPELLPGGVVLLPNGPQPPQLPFPAMGMQDFDGIVVPLPSYLEGHERVEFRSRIYQKVLDFIAEECIRRFGAPPGEQEQRPTDAPGPTDSTATSPVPTSSPQANAHTDVHRPPAPEATAAATAPGASSASAKVSDGVSCSEELPVPGDSTDDDGDVKMVRAAAADADQAPAQVAPPEEAEEEVATATPTPAPLLHRASTRHRRARIDV